MYVITSPSDSRIAVRVSGSREHVFTVHEQLMEHKGFPSDLEVHEEDDLPAPKAVTAWSKFNTWLAGG